MNHKHLENTVALSAVDQIILSNLRKEKDFIMYLRELFGVIRPGMEGRRSDVERERDVWKVMKLYYAFQKIRYNHDDSKEAALREFFKQ